LFRVVVALLLLALRSASLLFRVVVALLLLALRSASLLFRVVVALLLLALRSASLSFSRCKISTDSLSLRISAIEVLKKLGYDQILYLSTVIRCIKEMIDNCKH
jgi:hypothetical protein